jgi:ABC-type dipeptide/oligopeptide/nickel transport system permease component
MKFLLFLVRRGLWILLTLWVVYTISFFLMYAVPGGPFSSERQVPEAVRLNFEKRYRLDQPVHVQYREQLWLAVNGDFGLAFRLGDFTVNQVIGQGLPVSMSLGILSLTMAVFFGITAGVIASLHRNGVWDVTLMTLAGVGMSVPGFVLSGLAIALFVFWLGWFPAGGWGTLRQLILPSICLAAPYTAYIARLTRTGMLEVMHLDYVRTAHAKGLSAPVIVTRHMLKGALLPVISFLGPAAAGILTGSPILEKIFHIPGLGNHFVESALQRDYTLCQGMVVVYTLLLLTMNALVDIAYLIIDPRVKLE